MDKQEQATFTEERVAAEKAQEAKREAEFNKAFMAGFNREKHNPGNPHTPRPPQKRLPCGTPYR